VIAGTDSFHPRKGTAPPDDAGSGWLLHAAPSPPDDLTPLFLKLYAEALRGHGRLRALAGRDAVIIVPGLFTERYPFYLRHAVRRLRALGLEVRWAPIDTDMPALRNAAGVREAIRDLAREGRRAILVGHSKGPIDAAAALSLHPELASSVRALISLQAPYAGTPLAEEAHRSAFWRAAVRAVVGGLFRGSPRAFWELRYGERREFLQAHPLPPVRALSLVTTTARAGPILEWTRRLIAERYGAPSDGFVPPVDAYIPGSRLVHLNGVDHGGLALPFCRSLFEPGCALEALAATALLE
jgi:triacylglycerol lipase